MTTGQILLTSVLTSLCASIIFFALMALFRPRLKVSECIAKHWQPHLNQDVYQIKIYNRSYLPAIDVRVEALLVDRKHHNHGILLHAKELNFVRADISKLSGYRGSDKEAKYAWRMSIKNALTEEWTSAEQYIEVTVKACHPWSGFNRWFIHKYYLDTNPIKQGKFKTGRSMDIVTN